MKNSKGVSLIALIITIIVIIILAAIVMQASTDTVQNAQYAKFAQEFGEYADKVKSHAAQVNSDNSISGKMLSSPQQYYMVAAGIARASGDDGEQGFLLPVGYKLSVTGVTNTKNAANTDILLNILGIEKDTTAVAYVIADGAIPGYESNGKPSNDEGKATKNFYGNSNGDEYHFLTSRGQVFTLPGFPVQQTDGTVQYHIDTEQSHYYTIQGNSNLTNEKDPNNRDIINAPITATKLNGTYGKDANSAEKTELNKNAYKIKGVTASTSTTTPTTGN